MKIPDGVRLDIGITNESYIDNLPSNLDSLFIFLAIHTLNNLPTKLKQISCKHNCDEYINNAKLPYGCKVVDYDDDITMFKLKFLSDYPLTKYLKI